MNSVIISGTIKNIVYKLVDRGNIYALIILKLEVEKYKKNIEKQKQKLPGEHFSLSEICFYREKDT